MRIKRAIFLGIITLLTIILAGCPPTIPPPGDKLTAKEVWDILIPAGETLSNDAIPVYLEGWDYSLEYPIKEGITTNWRACFYSESKRTVWEVGYYSYQTKSGVESGTSAGSELYSDVSLAVYNLSDWNIDSPEACSIAAQNGAGEADCMFLRAGNLEILDQNTFFKTPEFIPESTKLFWVIMDEKGYYYIDACTGEYLGICTGEYLYNIPLSLGSGDMLFDIYYVDEVSRDINSDSTPEEIRFNAGEEESELTINGIRYTIPQLGLSELFAITDVDKGDGILEFVFTDKHPPEDGYAYSWLYWWNGTEILNMGPLMDITLPWVRRSYFYPPHFDPADHFDAKGTVTCKAATVEFTFIEYMARYTPSGDGRRLEEKLYDADPLETKNITCKQPCVLLKDISEDYYSPAYDYYWTTDLWPYTAGRVPDVSEGISIIAQPGEQLTIESVYGKYWFKLKTSDGYSGWIRCEGNVIESYGSTMGWNADDVFSGL